MGSSCTKLVPIPSAATTVDLSSCLSDRGAALYGLSSYKVTLSSTVNRDVITTNITFDRSVPAGMTVFYNTSLRTLRVENASQTPVPQIAANGADGEPPLTAYAIFQPLVPQSMVEPIQFLFDYNSNPGQIGVYARFYERVVFTLPGPGSVPNITAVIIPTHDGKEISELLFQVTNSTGTQNYRQPVVRFAPVICGCAGSLRQKILDLGEGEEFLQYLVLRYILSGIAYVQRFDVNLLRQRYNCSFLASLSGTEYEIFLPILKANPDFPRYFLC